MKKPRPDKKNKRNRRKMGASPTLKKYRLTGESLKKRQEAFRKRALANKPAILPADSGIDINLISNKIGEIIS